MLQILNPQKYCHTQICLLIPFIIIVKSCQNIYQTNLNQCPIRLIYTLNMMHPTSLPPLIKYNPFRAAFLFTLVMVICWAVFFPIAVNNCSNNCTSDYYFNIYKYNPCVKDGSLYCCSSSSYHGQYQCSWFTDCVLDNNICGGFTVAAWISGVLMLIGNITVLVVAFKYKQLKKTLQLQGAYHNFNNPNPPIYYNQSFQNQNGYLSNAPNIYPNNAGLNNNGYVSNQNNGFNGGR